MKKTIKKEYKKKVWAVYSQVGGFHAFYKLEEVALDHWRDRPKYGIHYQIFPVTVSFSLPKSKKQKI